LRGFIASYFDLILNTVSAQMDWNEDLGLLNVGGSMVVALLRNNSGSDIEVGPIQRVNEAYERVLKSDVRDRFVIAMASLKGN
jgi:alcohol dehydrogenase (NADP+)